MRIDVRETIRFETPAEVISVLGAKLRGFERRFDLRSSEFYAEYQEGPRKPVLDFEEWASTYELYVHYLGRIDSSISEPKEGVSTETPSSLVDSLSLAA